MITVINYGGGNIRSVINLLNGIGCDFKLTDNPEEVINSTAIIFPGQGHFGQSMQTLKEKKLDVAIKTAIEKKIPFLGICVGLQVLFENSEEAPNISGLGILKGSVVKFKEGKTPQIGWNKIKTTSSNSVLSDDYYYFVNSYYVKPSDETVVSSTSDYYTEFTASIEVGNLFGMQFHPEKSGEVGRNSIKKWIEKFEGENYAS